MRQIVERRDGPISDIELRDRHGGALAGEHRAGQKRCWNTGGDGRYCRAVPGPMALAAVGLRMRQYGCREPGPHSRSGRDVVQHVGNAARRGLQIDVAPRPCTEFAGALSLPRAAGRTCANRQGEPPIRPRGAVLTRGNARAANQKPTLAGVDIMVIGW
jgi:hypothetical protein